MTRTITAYTRVASGALLLVGIVGLLRTHFDDFASNDGVWLITFTVNPLMNLIHIAVGTVGVVMALDLGRARTYALWLGIGGLVLGALEFVVRDTSADILGRNTRLAVVHLLVGAIGVAVWVWTRRSPVPAPSPST